MLSSSANTAEGLHISSLVLWDNLEELGVIGELMASLNLSRAASLLGLRLKISSFR